MVTEELEENMLLKRKVLYLLLTFVMAAVLGFMVYKLFIENGSQSDPSGARFVMMEECDGEALQGAQT